LISRCEALAASKVPTGGPWLAGYYFNSALLRIAASYHQCLKLITAKPNGYVRSLREEVEKLQGEVPADAALLKVHEEVNSIKHDRGGLDSGRNVTFDIAVDAVAELIELLERHKTRLTVTQPLPTMQ
jgi:hypothetical protein